MRQQTVLFAQRAGDDQLLAATDLFTMSDDEFATLRRSATASWLELKTPKDGPVQPLLRCATCNQPLYLVRTIRAGGNRFFAHKRNEHIPASACPWHDGRKYSPEVVRALLFRGHSEGEEHRRLKHFIFDMLERDPEVSELRMEKTTFGEVAKGTWKRPDVACTWRGRKLVFEIQLSYTFITEVVKRSQFYQAESTHVIWVFTTADDKYSYVADEKYTNRRNLFVLDQSAIEASRIVGSLRLHCHYVQRVSEPEGAGQIDSNAAQLVGLADLEYPDTFRPYFHDYDATALDKEPSPPATVGLSRSFQHFSSVLKEFCEDKVDLKQLQAAASAIEEMELRAAALRAMHYRGLHALKVLTGIKSARPLGYRYQTIYEVLNAVTQPMSDGESVCFIYLYLEAWNTFQPKMTSAQSKRLGSRRRALRERLAGVDPQDLPEEGYFKLVVALFPELERSRLYLEDLKSDRARLESRLSDAPWPRGPLDWVVPNPDEKAVRGHAIRVQGIISPKVVWRAMMLEANKRRTDGDDAVEAIRGLAAQYSVTPRELEDFLRRCKLVR